LRNSESIRLGKVKGSKNLVFNRKLSQIQTPTPTAKPSPSPDLLETTVQVKTDNGITVDLVIKGNVTSLQMSNVTIATNQSAASSTVYFTVTGESGTTGFSIITIPKTAILYETTPVVFIDDQQATNQGYAQDPENFYVWYVAHFSTHQMKIHFLLPLTSQAVSFGTVFAIGSIVPEIVLIYVVIAVKRLRRKLKTHNETLKITLTQQLLFLGFVFIIRT
jgi:hypothetical protein